MKKKEHPSWAIAHKQPGTELRLIRGRYYLYEYKTVYDPQRKGPRKITGKILGSITEAGGFIPSGKRQLEKAAREKGIVVQPVCKEFGVSHLVTSHFTTYLDKLRAAFPLQWAEIAALAYCRLLYQSPLKSVASRLEQSYLGALLPHGGLNAKSASALLNNLGGMRAEQLSYMRSFLTKGEYLLMDATQVGSHSRLMALSRPGYNAKLDFDPQFNLLYLYSSKTHLPTYFRILPGNVREVRAFRLSLEEVGLSKAVIVADKGFGSKKNIEQLRQEKLQFVLPLKRNNTLIDYSPIRDNTFRQGAQFFEHQGRIIWYQDYTYDGMVLVTYLDESLRLEEDRDYLRRISTHPETHTIEDYHRLKDAFGTMTLLSNLRGKSALNLYQTYKSRGAIETMFDSMKNVLDADRTYMQNEQTLTGWMFVNHIALQWYQHLYIELVEKQMLSKYSVSDYLQLLSDARMIKINETWRLAELTSSTRKLINKLGLALE